MHDWELIWTARGMLAEGIGLTLRVFLPAAVILVVIACAMGIALGSSRRPLRVASAAFVETFRGIPLLVLLFWMYFCLPYLGVRLDAVTTAILACGICSGAYGAEIVRGAIASVPRALLEAAQALNFRPDQKLRLVILPTALPAALPPMCNQMIELLKSTTLVSLITVGDLSFQASALRSTTMRSAEIFTSVLILYFLMSLVIIVMFRLLEAWTGTGLGRGEAR